MFPSLCPLDQRFFDVMSKRTDAPDQFIHATFLAVASTLLGRKVWITFAGRRMYTTMWIVLLGRSSNLRKTTCIEFGRSLVESTVEAEKLVILPQSCSFEAFLEAFANRIGYDEAQSDLYAHTGFYTVPEFSVLLATLKKRYNEGMIQTLTDIYDSPVRVARKTRGAGEFVLNRPFLSILSGTTLEWLTTYLGIEDVQSGFLPRFTFVPAGVRTRTIEFPDCRDTDDLASLIDELKRLFAFQGELICEPPAIDAYTALIREFPTSEDTARSAFETRSQIMFLRLAMIHTVCNGATAVTLKAMEAVEPVWHWLHGVIPRLTGEELAFTKRDKVRVRVLRYLRTHGNAATKSQLLRMTHLPKRELDVLLDTLIASSLLRTEIRQSVTWYLLVEVE